MKLQTPIAALLLAAMPAAALAAPHGGDRGGHTTSYSNYSRPAVSTRSYQQAPRYQTAPQRTYVQNNYVQHNYVQRNYTTNYVQHTYTANYAAHGFIGHPRFSYAGNPWGWNAGRVWVAEPRFWGGGFWGAFALNVELGAPAPAYYQVQAGYPGAQLLANYGLQQTDCNQPNLVDIYGPDGSQICAFPNDEVGPGAYSVDPATLTLVSQ
jgi:hypothetical protein